MPSIFSKATFHKLLAGFPKLTGDILIYGIGGSLAQIVGLVTIPIITRILTSSEYGSVDVITAAAAYFTVLITLNLGTGLMRFYYETTGDPEVDRTKMVSSLAWFTLVFGGLVAGLVALFAGGLSDMLFDTPAYGTAITLAVASLPFVALKELFKNVLRMQRKPVNFLAINILYALVTFALILLFVWGTKDGIEGYFWAQLISAVIAALVSAWLCRHHLGFNFSRRWFWLMAAYSLPMVPGGLFTWGMTYVNRILLTQYTTASQIAYYGMATKAAKVIELVVTAFILGWFPVFLQYINSPTFHAKMDRVFRYYFFATVSLSAVVTAFGREFFMLLAPPEYAAGVVLVALLCLKQVFYGSTYTYTVGITQTKKTYFVSISTGLGVAATILFSLLLLPGYGIFGAALADLLGTFVYALLMLVFSERLVKLNLNYLPVILAIVGFLLLWGVCVLVQLPNPWLDALLRAGLLAAYLVFVYTIIDRGQILKKLLSAVRRMAD